MSLPIDDVRLSRASQRGFKYFLLIGFALCGVASLAAYDSPASRFELSIYHSTPLVFWVAAAGSLLIGLVTSVFARGRLRALSGLLSTTVFASIVSLPLLRGYYFYGEYDSLTHIGWVKDVDTGALSPFDLFYPAVHELTLLIRLVTGFSIPRSLLFVVFLFPIVFVVFHALAVYVLVGDSFGAVIGLYAGMLLLPINQIATHYMAPHPFSETVLYSALTIYLLVRYLRWEQGERIGRLPLGLLVASSSLAMVFLHPLEAAVFVVVFCVIAGLQFVHRRYAPAHPLATNQPTYALAAFHVVVFTLWTAGKPKFTGTFDLARNEIDSAISGGGAVAGAVVQQQSTSLTAVGSGLEDIFLRLLLVSALFAVAAGVVTLLSVAGRLDHRLPEVKYIGASLVVLVPLSFVFFVGNVSKLFFRVHGSIMVFGTLLGTIGILLLVQRGRRVLSARTVRLVVTVVLCLLLIHSMAIVYTSPYIYKFNRQVSQADYDGYESAFANQAEGVMFAGIRQTPSRYMHAIYGRESVPASKDVIYHGYAETATVPGANLTDLDGYFQDDHYVIVTTRDVERELGGYRGLRYNESQFESISRQTDVHRVQSNGAFRLYLYDAPTESVESRA